MMTPEQAELLKYHMDEIAKILWNPFEISKKWLQAASPLA
jgi:hypothetical protein